MASIALTKAASAKSLQNGDDRNSDDANDGASGDYCARSFGTVSTSASSAAGLRCKFLAGKRPSTRQVRNRVSGGRATTRAEGVEDAVEAAARSFGEEQQEELSLIKKSGSEGTRTLSTVSFSSHSSCALPLRVVAMTLLTVDVRDRRYNLRMYRDCFVGRQAVTVLVASGICQSRKQAVRLGQKVAFRYKLFHHVCSEHDFEDENYFYRFDDERVLAMMNDTSCTDAQGDISVSVGSSCARLSRSGASNQEEKTPPPLVITCPKNDDPENGAEDKALQLVIECDTSDDDSEDRKDRKKNDELHVIHESGETLPTSVQPPRSCPGDSPKNRKVPNPMPCQASHATEQSRQSCHIRAPTPPPKPCHSSLVGPTIARRRKSCSQKPDLATIHSGQTFHCSISCSDQQILSALGRFLRANAKVADRRYRLKTYRGCFVGREAVDLFVERRMAKTRQDAVRIGRILQKELNLFEHVCSEHPFEDGYLFYRFNY